MKVEFKDLLVGDIFSYQGHLFERLDDILEGEKIVSNSQLFRDPEQMGLFGPDVDVEVHAFTTTVRSQVEDVKGFIERS